MQQRSGRTSCDHYMRVAAGSASKLSVHVSLRSSACLMVSALPELVLGKPPYLLAALSRHHCCQGAVRAQQLRVPGEQLERNAINSRGEAEARPVQRFDDSGVTHLTSVSLW